MAYKTRKFCEHVSMLFKFDAWNTVIDIDLGCLSSEIISYQQLDLGKQWWTTDLNKLWFFFGVAVINQFRK